MRIGGQRNPHKSDFWRRSLTQQQPSRVDVAANYKRQDENQFGVKFALIGSDLSIDTAINGLVGHEISSVHRHG